MSAAAVVKHWQERRALTPLRLSQTCMPSTLPALPHPLPLNPHSPAPPTATLWQLLYFGGELADMRRSSPGEQKGSMLPLSSSDVQPGSAPAVQMASVSYSYGGGGGSNVNPFATSV